MSTCRGLGAAIQFRTGDTRSGFSASHAETCRGRRGHGAIKRSVGAEVQPKLHEPRRNSITIQRLFRFSRLVIVAAIVL
jgi:hypothetical protein